jgi:hypothetical protein
LKWLYVVVQGYGRRKLKGACPRYLAAGRTGAVPVPKPSKTFYTNHQSKKDVLNTVEI